MDDTSGCSCSDTNEILLDETQEPEGTTIETDPWFNLDISHTWDGMVETPVGPVQRIKTHLSRRDHFQDWKARWSLKRENFKIPAGLYAIGNPDPDSPVLVTANYKLTFDKLRRELEGMNLWLMILDTWGINVWCSAGKGTFSAHEIIHRIEVTRLNQIVRHRELILPQLAASGVRAPEVKRQSGFQVIYGPIRASDISEFLRNGKKASRQMRTVRFDLWDRIILTPIEIVASIRVLPLIYFMLFLINWIHHGPMGLVQGLQTTLYNTIPYLGAIITGALLFPIMLPILPFRAFSLKGLVLGLLWSAGVIGMHRIFLLSDQWSALAGHALILTAIISYLSLNFTGSTTFTSFSGANRETLTAFPLTIIVSLAGIILLILSRFIGV